jgi:hypothetical protein
MKIDPGHVWRTTMQTEHFTFEGYGYSEEDANGALGRALDVHARQYAIADPEWWTPYAQESERLEFGGYRDGERIAP